MAAAVVVQWARGEGWPSGGDERAVRARARLNEGVRRGCGGNGGREAGRRRRRWRAGSGARRFPSGGNVCRSGVPKRPPFPANPPKVPGRRPPWTPRPPVRQMYPGGPSFAGHHSVPVDCLRFRDKRPSARGNRPVEVRRSSAVPA